MSPTDAAQVLADTMNQIEAAGFILYPHPRPISISIRILRDGLERAAHPDDTIRVASISDEGDGQGWRVK